MTTTLFIFFTIGIFHLIYQSLLLPTIRLNLRFKLFSLRDELRLLKHQKGDDLDDKVVYDLQKTINKNINNLAYIDFSTIYKTNKYFEENPKLNSKIEIRKNYLDSSPVSEVKTIYKENVKLFLLTIAANSGGWIIYIIPAIIIALTFNSIKNLVRKLVFVPEYDLDKIVTNSTAIKLA